MGKEIFKSDRYFTVFDFLISHGQLLLRSCKSEKQKSNIDVIFFGVKYIQLLTSLDGVTISHLEKHKTPIRHDAVMAFLSHEENNIFEIRSNSDIFYVAASCVRVFENELDFHETSLGFEGLGREHEL